MTLLRSMVRSLPLVTGLVAVTSATAAADQPLFSFAGTVDRELYIVLRGNDLSTQGVDANQPYRARVTNAVPRGRGNVEVRVEEGRGTVAVIEQPNARNGYQAVVRIQDPRGGADRYRLTAVWRDDDFDRDDRRDRGDEDRWRNDRDRRDGGVRDGDGRGGDRDWRDGDSWFERDRRGPRGGYGAAGALRWSGRVDDVVEVRIQGRRVDFITRSGKALRDVNADIVGAGLPRAKVRVDIDKRSGRGAVDVVQQPSAANGYTAIIRLEDRRSGADDYDFRARW